MNPAGPSHPRSLATLGLRASLYPLHAATPPGPTPLPPPSVIPTGHSYVSVVRFAPRQAPSGPSADPPASAPPGADAAFSLGPVRSAALPPRSPGPSRAPPPPSTPYPAPSYQVSVIVPSPDLQPPPLQRRCSEGAPPDLECSVCFSQFNNVFRCPKMLQCRHTFCLECLARINVKSPQPSTIQCPLCRGVTTLPALGLPTLATDVGVLEYLPAAMQRVSSVRFLRSKGRLQVKRSFAGVRRWRRRSDRSLDVGLPSPPAGNDGEEGRLSEALIRLTGRPACRAFLLTSVVLMIVLLTGVVVFLLTFRPDDKSV